MRNVRCNQISQPSVEFKYNVNIFTYLWIILILDNTIIPLYHVWCMMYDVWCIIILMMILHEVITSTQLVNDTRMSCMCDNRPFICGRSINGPDHTVTHNANVYKSTYTELSKVKKWDKIKYLLLSGIHEIAVCGRGGGEMPLVEGQ